jgi:chlorocatechol 1,2-dioxygenase
MSDRLEAVVVDIIEGVRGALNKHDVTFDEYKLAPAVAAHAVAAAE